MAPWDDQPASAAASTHPEPQACACHQACPGASERRGVSAVRDAHCRCCCRRDGSACQPAQGCCPPCAPVHRGDSAVRGFPVVAAPLCRGDVAQVCPPAPDEASGVPAERMAWRQHRGGWAQPDVLRHRRQAAWERWLGPRSAVSVPGSVGRGLQPAGGSAWLQLVSLRPVYWRQGVPAQAWLLRGVPAERMVWRLEPVCSPPPVCWPAVSRQPPVWPRAWREQAGGQAWLRTVELVPRTPTAWQQPVCWAGAWLPRQDVPVERTPWRGMPQPVPPVWLPPACWAGPGLERLPAWQHSAWPVPAWRLPALPAVLPS